MVRVRRDGNIDELVLAELVAAVRDGRIAPDCSSPPGFSRGAA